MRRLILPSILAVLVVTLGCEYGSPPVPAPPPPAPVTAAPVRSRMVPVELRAIGNTKVFATVAVRPRVSGELTGVHFREGDYVKAGDKLFTIDPRPYQTAYDRAKAQLEKDLALLRGAELVLERARQLAGTAAVTADELDKLRTDVASAAATVAADRAALKTAEIQLGYTTIYSPIEGRTGNLLVTVGNLVTADETAPLVVINQISPLAVVFNVPELHLPAIQTNLERAGGSLPVRIRLRDGTVIDGGALTFVDNAVENQSGTIQLKARFENSDRRLWPGQFVDVVVTLNHRENCLTVPASAVQTGQQGPYVFVVTSAQTAELRPVVVDFVAPDGEIVIASGVQAGERVITDGHLRVAPGGPVAVRESAGTTP